MPPEDRPKLKDLVTVIKFMPSPPPSPSWAPRRDFEICFTRHYAGAARRTFFPTQLEADFSDLLAQKANRNVLIAGTSGEGKTTLLVHAARRIGLPVLYFNFKPGDMFLRIGLPVLPAREVLPELNSLQPDDVVTAYMLAYWLEFKRGGVMASQIPTIIREALRDARTWDEFLGRLRNLEVRGFSRVLLDSLVSRFDHEIFSGLRAFTSWQWDFKTSCVIDFSSAAIEPQRIFWCEIMLRYLWRSLSQRRDFAVVIDEAHHLTRTVENYSGIIDLLARQLRSLGACLLIATQNFSDVPDSTANQFETQLIMKTTNEADLANLSRVMRNVGALVQAMLKYHFFDLRSAPDQDGYVNVYALKPEFVPEPVPAPEVPAEIAPKSRRLEVEQRAEARATPIEIKPDSHAKLDLKRVRREVLELLEDGAVYVSGIAREIATRHGLNAEHLKPDIHALLKGMVADGSVVCSELEDEKGQRLVFYWLRKKRESPFHRLMVDRAERLLEGLPQTERHGADLACLFEGERVAVEVETGLKGDTTLKRSFSRQLAERLKLFDRVWVVAPSRAQRRRFRVEGSQERRVRVMTLKELEKQVRP
jgi:hypothetical protein